MITSKVEGHVGSICRKKWDPVGYWCINSIVSRLFKQQAWLDTIKGSSRAASRMPTGEVSTLEFSQTNQDGSIEPPSCNQNNLTRTILTKRLEQRLKQNLSAFSLAFHSFKSDAGQFTRHGLGLPIEAE